MKYGKVHTDGSRSGGQKPMDIVERMARAICLESSGTGEAWEEYVPEARAALAAMLEAVGEPVAWRYGRWQEWGGVVLSSTRWQPKLGFTETPLYSLAALREDGL